MSIQALQNLIDYLASDRLTVEMIVNHLGSIEESHAGSIHIQPNIDDFSLISVVRAVDSIYPSHLRVTLRQPIAISELTQTFGDPRSITMEEGEPYAILYDIGLSNTTYNITLLAELDAEKLVTTIILRLDTLV